MLNKSYHSSSRTIKVINISRVAWFATDSVPQRSENSKNIPRHTASIIAKCNQLNIKGPFNGGKFQMHGQKGNLFFNFRSPMARKRNRRNTNNKTVYEPVCVSVWAEHAKVFRQIYIPRVFFAYLQTQKYDFCSPGRWINSFAVAVPVCMHPWIQIYPSREMRFPEIGGSWSVSAGNLKKVSLTANPLT